MTPESAADLERRIVSRLHPLEGVVGDEGQGSDFDLNPEMDPGDAALTDAAVLVPVLVRPGGLHVLFTRRTDTLTKHAGQVSFPGGRCDPGESAVEAALREAEEEVGLDRAFVRPLALADRYVTGTGYRIAPVVAFVREGFTLTASPAEVAEVFETPWTWLMDPANAALHTREIGAWGRRRFHAYTWEGRFIWGATAGMLNALRRRLYEEAA